MKISTGELEAHTLAKRRVMLKTEAQDLKLFGFPIFQFRLHVMQSHRISLSGCMRSYSN
jgi:hypothetical protein